MDIEKWISVFNKSEDYIIWGCTEFTEALLDTVNDIMNVVFIVDRNSALDGSVFHGVKVHDINYFIHTMKSNHYKIIVSNRYTGTRKEIVSQLIEMGLVENRDFSYYEYFISIWPWKYKGQIAASYIELPITTRCTLNCAKCAAYIPYVNHHKDRNIDNIISDVDNYFSVIDYVARFRLVGGEPLLYVDLTELIETICKKYRDNIGEFTIVTNGTINPKKKLLEVLKRNNVNVSISDYRKAHLSQVTNYKYNRLCKTLEENGIKYYLNSSLRWMDLGNPLLEQNITDKVLRIRFADCNIDRRSLVDGKIFRCSNIGSAYNDKLGVEIMSGDYIECSELANRKGEERFIKWFDLDTLCKSENGYLDFCRRCNGEGSLNNNFIPVAEQMK